ncbi:hypothetical protein [Endozoicomonas sp. ALB115]|uniref:hypothetical protein n=1 Tax=Endozoicomonas sp. ALB115 TaxID=3403074 RepID=UPI003BB57E96
MLNQLEQWIETTLTESAPQRTPCTTLLPYFSGFYSPELLQESYFVIVENLPIPDFPELRDQGLGGFLDMDIQGITYKNTYFIKKGFEQKLRLHFHELVHVLQWRYFGSREFINRYIDEIQQFGYDNAPLERMAYSLEDKFTTSNRPFDVEKYVSIAIPLV